MPVTFKQIQGEAYRGPFITPDVHGEKVLLIRNLGRMEDQQAILEAIAAAQVANQYMTCSISEDVEDPDELDDGATLHRMEKIMVQCCRDPAAVNSKGEPLLGIADPNVRDGILRLVVKDPLQIPYFFQRESRNSTDVLWRLKFARYIAGVRGIPG